MSTHAFVERSDAAHDHLESLVQRRLGNRIRDLHIVKEPAGIIIQGRSLTYHAKQLASHAAMELSKLPIVANEIVVV